jgi:hypothetical protein
MPPVLHRRYLTTNLSRPMQLAARAEVDEPTAHLPASSRCFSHQPKSKTFASFAPWRENHNVRTPVEFGIEFELDPGDISFRCRPRKTWLRPPATSDR